MIGKTAFSVGLGRLAIATRQPLDTSTVDVYHEALNGETNPPEWEEFTKEAARDGVFDGWFPKLHEITPVLCQWREGRKMEAMRARALPEHHESDTERIERNRRGRELFRAELARLGVTDPDKPVRVVTEPRAERGEGFTRATE